MRNFVINLQISAVLEIQRFYRAPNPTLYDGGDPFAIEHISTDRKMIAVEFWCTLFCYDWAIFVRHAKGRTIASGKNYNSIRLISYPHLVWPWPDGSIYQEWEICHKT